MPIPPNSGILIYALFSRHFCSIFAAFLAFVMKTKRLKLELSRKRENRQPGCISTLLTAVWVIAERNKIHVWTSESLRNPTMCFSIARNNSLFEHRFWLASLFYIGCLNISLEGQNQYYLFSCRIFGTRLCVSSSGYLKIKYIILISEKNNISRKTNFLYAPLGDTHNGGLPLRSPRIGILQAARVPFDYRN